MLVLTRSKDQRVVIEVGGLELEVKVIETRGDRVRLGFDGPRDFKIIRQELREEIAAENQAASTITPGDVAGA